VHSRKRYQISYLSPEEWKELDRLSKVERDSLILNLLYETGCTVNELVNIKTRDFTGNILKIRSHHARNREARSVFISESLLKRIRAFCQTATSGEYLFSTRQSRSMSTKRIRQLVQKYCSVCGIIGANPQILRYTHIVHAYQKGIPLEAIQNQVGLKRSRAIEIFEQLPERKTTDAYRKFMD